MNAIGTRPDEADLNSRRHLTAAGSRAVGAGRHGGRLALLCALLTTLPASAQVPGFLDESAREPVQVGVLTFDCRRGSGQETMYRVPADKLLVIESVSVIISTPDESELYAYLDITYPHDPLIPGPPGPTFRYIIPLIPANSVFHPQSGGVFTSRDARSGNLFGRIYAGRTALLQPKLNANAVAHVQVNISVENMPLVACAAWANLSGYLLPLDSPTLSP